ncbi:MAG: monofunctional biosynthetic peptidoglycan transglycosylase [Paracoccaceae bacterium]
MAKAVKRKPSRSKRAKKKSVARGRSAGVGFQPIRWIIRWLFRGATAVGLLMFLAVVIYGIFDPPTTPYMYSEGRSGKPVDQQWVDIEEIAPVMVRSVVAAEDANYCLHWGFDMAAIRKALDGGSARGASTISQQVVKNVYLWQGRSWARKAIEALMTPMVEAVWTKRRIVEVYLNVAEFGDGVFGVEAAARSYFRVGPEALQPWQAARLAAVLPSPKKRSVSHPTAFVKKRARLIVDGAATILADGRADCFER